MNGQHTPGPWSADKWATGYTVSAPESHYSVCHLEDCNNAEANARLIAAAPDLLEACEQFFRYATNGKHPGWATYINTVAGQKLRNAIAKAKP